MGKNDGCRNYGDCKQRRKKRIGKNYEFRNVINYARENFAEQIRDITQGRGVDVVFDSVGASTFYQSIQSLKIWLMVSYGKRIWKSFGF